MQEMREKAPRRHTVGQWILAVRPWSFPASAMPVVVTLAYVFWKGYEISWTNGVWALLNIVIFHAVGNTWSDYFDFKAGVDADDTYGSKVIAGGTFQPREIFRYALALLAVAVVAGLGLWWRTGNTVLYIGLAGCLAALLYPPLKYRALGDLVIFVTYAFLPTIGTSFVAAGFIDWSVMWIAVPVGLITVAILHANNTRDIRTDGRAEILTLAMALGARLSVRIYCAEVLVPFVWMVLCVAFGVFPWWSLIILLALAPALKNVRVANSYFRGGASEIAQLDVLTATLQIQFSVLFALSFVLAGLI
ncbi:MAG: prenyltransferase [Prevotellaceae bacterium]|nr:prenyltransferase [Prevotellaceae bacterium]MCD8303661.1 prenyltransferase [Prevotellaceae bacterium]